LSAVLLPPLLLLLLLLVVVFIVIIGGALADTVTIVGVSSEEFQHQKRFQ
jgi:hypothetical protein